MAIVHTRTQHHVAPAQSQLARFVVADLKGGEKQHAFRMSLVQSAITEALKGNFNPLREAGEFAIGKARKAAAYQSGFAAVLRAAEAFHPDGWDKGGIAKVPYVGKLDASSNASARAAIDLQTGVLTAAFESAFVAYDAQAAAQAKAKAAEAKTKKLAAAPAPAAPEAAAPAPATPASVEVDTGELVAMLASALATGALTGNEVIQLREALASYDALQLAGAVDMTAQGSLPSEQAAA